MDSTTNLDENGSQVLKTDYDSEQMRATVESLHIPKRTDGRPKGTPRDNRVTLKQRLFINGLVEGKTQEQAYRDAFKSNAKSSTVKSNAAKLLKLPKVKELLDEALTKTQNDLIHDRRLMRLHIMEQLLEHAKNMNDNNKLRALELLGKSIGLYTDKVEQTVEQVSPDKLKADLERHLELIDSTTKH